MRKTNFLMISDPVSKVIASAGELKVLKLQKGQQLQVKVKNIIRSGGCLWVLLDDAKQVFSQGSEVLLLRDVSMLLPRNSYPQIHQNALATSVEASSSGNPNFSINNCLDV